MTVTLHQVPATAPRIYDALLGGYDNAAADREIARRLAAAHPVLSQLAQENRRFARQAVTWLSSVNGISRFLDLGCGLPCRMPDGSREPLVHEIARSMGADPQVVYVDDDARVVSQMTAAARAETGVSVLRADLADTSAVLGSQAVKSLLGAGEPVCVIVTGVLHYWTAVRARAIMRAYVDALPARSAVVVSTCRLEDPAGIAERRAAVPGMAFHEHSMASIRSFFAGLRVHAEPRDVRRWPLPAPEDQRTGRIVGEVGIKG